jgi:glycosyltransferase involved in cell wall biosynthesis
MNNDLVSIITPSYNTANYVIETIESVVAQTYTNWEMIIVDDCSTDDSVELVKSYIKANNEHRIRLFINQENSGAALSRNLALREARGRWIAFLDSDDLWLPDKIELQLAFMKKNNYQFTYTEYEEINEQGKSLKRKISGPKCVTKQKMNNYCYPGCLTVMYDQTEIGLIQINDIKKNNDYAMWLKACRKANCWLLDKNLAKYRKRSSSISRHGIFIMIVWHYRLWHESEEKGTLSSIWYTLKNLIYGYQKKMIFIK